MHFKATSKPPGHLLADETPSEAEEGLEHDNDDDEYAVEGGDSVQLGLLSKQRRPSNEIVEPDTMRSLAKSILAEVRDSPVFPILSRPDECT